MRIASTLRNIKQISTRSFWALQRRAGTSLDMPFCVQRQVWSSAVHDQTGPADSEAGGDQLPAIEANSAGEDGAEGGGMMNLAQTQPCKKCGSAVRNKNGRCAECHRAAAALYRLNNPEKYKASQRAYCENNPEKRKESHRKYHSANKKIVTRNRESGTPRTKIDQIAGQLSGEKPSRNGSGIERRMA